MKLRSFAAAAALTMATASGAAPVLAPPATLGPDVQPFVHIPAGQIAITHLRIGALMRALRPSETESENRVSANGLRALLGKKRRTRAPGPRPLKLSKIR